jgi:hypothetical protein
MPVQIRKSGGGYSVSTPGGVKAKHTTLAKAKAQERLLNALEHNPDFKPRGKSLARSYMKSRKK